MKPSLLWTLTRAALLICCALLGLLAGALLHRRQTPRYAPQALVAFLNVGDGDCALVRTANGTTILLDAGRAETAPGVVRALHRLHVKSLDLLALASSDPKSCGGVPAVLAAFPTRAVWDNAATGSSPARQAALAAIRNRHIPSRTAAAGDNIQIGAGTFWTALWPPARGPRSRKDSVVYQLNFGATRVLFAGPLRPEGEKFLIGDRGDALGCDSGACTDLIMQATAGGAEGSMVPELLRQAAPAVVVVSCSADKPPAPGVLHGLQVSGAALWRTDTQGDVLVSTDGRGAPSVTSAHL